MADSIVFPTPTPSVARYNSNLSLQLYHYRIDAQDELVLPKGLVEAEIADNILDNSILDLFSSFIGFSMLANEDDLVRKRSILCFIQGMKKIAGYSSKNGDTHDNVTDHLHYLSNR